MKLQSKMCFIAINSCFSNGGVLYLKTVFTLYRNLFADLKHLHLTNQQKQNKSLRKQIRFFLFYITVPTRCSECLVSLPPFTSLHLLPSRLSHVAAANSAHHHLLHAAGALPRQRHLHHVLPAARQVLGAKLQVRPLPPAARPSRKNKREAFCRHNLKMSE